MRLEKESKKLSSSLFTIYCLDCAVNRYYDYTWSNCKNYKEWRRKEKWMCNKSQKSATAYFSQGTKKVFISYYENVSTNMFNNGK